MAGGKTDRVSVGYVHSTDVKTLFMVSLLRLLLRDSAQGRRFAHAAGHLSEFSSANISTARNELVRKFLAGDAHWLFMVDTDMVFEPDVVERLLGSAYSGARRVADVIGGLCFGAQDGRLFPTLYAVRDGEVFRFAEYPRDSLVEVSATGAACLLIHRSVLERVGQVQAEAGNTAFPWFQESVFEGRPAGEDFTFCWRAGECGFRVWVDTSVRVGHVKQTVFTESMFDAQAAV